MNITIGGGIFYNVLSIQKCEYIAAMQKIYAKPPKQTAEVCHGFKNKYSGAPSLICRQCPYWEENINEFDRSTSKSD